MTIRRQHGYGGRTERPVTISERATGTLGVATGGDTTLLTLDQFPADRNPVLINASVQMSTGNDGELILKLFRDGSEIETSDRYSGLDNVAPRTLSCHWVDTTPGQKPVYTLVAEATGDPVDVNNRRLTAVT